MGDTNSPNMVLYKPGIRIACRPYPAHTAPIKPPISVCEILAGILNHSVNAHHVIAPTNAAITTCAVVAWALTSSAPIVLATAMPSKYGPTPKPSAAKSSACRGPSALEDTIVATIEAEAWTPFKYPYRSARTGMIAM